MNLGDRIMNLRKNQKLSQEQLAEKISVTRQTISNWELGDTNPNPEQLKMLSKQFGISIDELLNNDTKEIVVEKISNVEKTAEKIYKLLKIFCKSLIVIFIIIILISMIYSSIMS